MNKLSVWIGAGAILIGAIAGEAFSDNISYRSIKPPLTGDVTTSGGGSVTTLAKIAALTQGSIPFLGASSVVTENNANLFWDNSALALGIGTALPAAQLNTKVSNSANFAGITAEQGSTGNAVFQWLITATQSWTAGIDHKAGANAFTISRSNDGFAAANRAVTISVSTLNWLYQNGGHHEYKGTAPAVTTGAADCGTTPSVVGSDSVGRVTVGSGANGGKCTITFVTAFANNVVCEVEDETTGVLVRPASPGTGTVAFTGVIVAGDTLAYHCFGYQ